MQLVPINLTLTPRQAAQFQDLIDTWLAKGGPAWECMAEWDEPYTHEESEALYLALDAAIPAPK